MSLSADFLYNGIQASAALVQATSHTTSAPIQAIRGLTLGIGVIEAVIRGAIQAKAALDASPLIGRVRDEIFLEKIVSDPYGLHANRRQLIELSTNRGMFLKPQSDIYPKDLMYLDFCKCGICPPKWRLEIESLTLKALNNQPISSHKRFTIVSVGPEGCYQELVFLAKLVKLGYRNIHLVLIDRNEFIAKEQLRNICKQRLSMANIEITQFLSLESYVEAAVNGSENEIRPNLLLLIDLAEQKFYIDNKPLPDVAFELFRAKNILSHETIVAHTICEYNPAKTAAKPGYFVFSNDGRASLKDGKSDGKVAKNWRGNYNLPHGNKI